MTRLAIAFAAFLCLSTSATATLSSALNDLPRPKTFSPELINKVSQRVVREGPAREQKEALTITDRTEIKLDGRPCAYKDVPAHAAVILLEVAPDQRTVLKAHFRTRK